MNPLLMQMLARQAGLPESASLAEITGTLAANNPQLQLMLEMMGRQKNASPEVAEEDLDEPLLEDEPEPDADVEPDNGSLTSAIAEVLALRKRCDALALALGSCMLCWGEAEDCPHCRGRGGPGWHQPDPTYFHAIVAPAIARLQRSAQAQASQRVNNPKQQFKKPKEHTNE